MKIPYYKDQHRSSKRCSSAGSEAPGGLCIGAGPENVYLIVLISYIMGASPEDIYLCVIIMTYHWSRP